MKINLLVPGLALLLALTGCRSIGPGSVARDRFDYSDSLSESWKRQTLLNIVKLRYLDPPIFVDVGQIVSGYTLQTTATAGGTVNFPATGPSSSAINLGAAGSYTDRPTVTYIPLTGNKFVKGLMTPLPPASVFFTIQSGWPADGVLFATVSEINGLKNQTTSINGVTPPQPEFLRVLQLMRRIQLSGAVAMRVNEDAARQQTTILTFRSKNIPQETLDDIRELRRLLRIDPNAEELRLVFGATSVNDREIAVLTRSMMQQMATLASHVEVPPEHIAEGRASPGYERSTNVVEIAAGVAPVTGGGATIAGGTAAPRLVQIHSANSEPADAFVKIRYRDLWFWIDDRDLKSKRTFSFMMMLFTLADTGEKENLPLITIPAQ